jgi:hypothetical protein
MNLSDLIGKAIYEEKVNKNNDDRYNWNECKLSERKKQWKCC